MKKNKDTYALLFVAYIVQCVFFLNNSGEQNPFAFLLGLTPVEEMLGVPYFHICVLCVPIVLITLCFSDYYSFYIENYGRLLLIRNCNIIRMLFWIYAKIGYRLVLITIMQFIINVICFYDFVIGNIRLLLIGGMVYLLFINLVVILQFYLCTFMKNNYAYVMVNLYVYLSFVLHRSFDVKIINLLFLPGQMVNLKATLQNVEVGNWILQQVLYSLGMFIVIHIATVIRCKRKDIF